MSSTTEDTIAHRISRVLADRIITGVLRPDTRLRQEHIAEEFGTSHVPVREALRRLEAQGLAVSEARRGVRVASFTSAAVEEATRMRSVLEGLALRQAAPHLTPHILDQAEIVARACDQAVDVVQQETANREFHGLLLAPCEMPRLLAEIDDLHMVGSRSLFLEDRKGRVAPRFDADHHAVLQHLRSGKLDEAVRTLERHVLRLIETPLRSSARPRASE
ncbi:DNA-binding transcriptional regulator, GntR family [Rhizobium sp. NFR07]|uniref:GntR family transcriptional regulator n=1 Tax=Rhizobium sp. NFR07 TaxID=1566262 RepID=UPI0008E46EFC|nr:GntR family transcriptional regulator [Rhizobium sp. NFR07]SFA79540.1 DNA-binding transcriptional regulator, GntR family [Rhizobium sp. NFR07]